MKKFIIAILAFFYLGSSTGATIHMHYCMGKLVNWGVGHSDAHECDNCGMEMSDEADNGCCKSEHKQVKIENDQKLAESQIHLMQSITIAQPVSHLQADLSLPDSVEDTKHAWANAPPSSPQPPIYLLNCIFRI